MASYWQIFISFFKIGSFTLGGGYAMIPLIQQEVVDKKGWLKESEFVEMMAIAQSAPGPIALNTAIFVGYKTRGIKGVIFSSLGTILPSFIVILLIAIIFTDFKTKSVFQFPILNFQLTCQNSISISASLSPSSKSAYSVLGAVTPCSR